MPLSPANRVRAQKPGGRSIGGVNSRFWGGTSQIVVVAGQRGREPDEDTRAGRGVGAIPVLGVAAAVVDADAEDLARRRQRAFERDVGERDVRMVGLRAGGELRLRQLDDEVVTAVMGGFPGLLRALLPGVPGV